ncbi:MAG: glycosyltransferase [Lachnospiraceae bacterium]|nr:glycosyltransferase [Lachnospiraceae bacterium]
MKFSIITVSLNSGIKLLETVENVLKQTCKDFEIIIKDGGSKDDSLSKVKDLNSPFVKIFEGPDTGIYDAMNQAVKHASGDYVLFLNAGDKFYSGDVLERVARLDLPDKGAIVYGDTYFVAWDSLSKAPPVITGSVCYRNIPCHQAIFYSRDVLTERGFDTSYKIRADFEHFAYSFFEAKRKFIYAGFPICLYEGNGVSESKANRQRDREEYKRAVRTNIPVGKRFIYRATLILTLHRLRGALARNPKTAKLYQKIKGKLYG